MNLLKTWTNATVRGLGERTVTRLLHFLHLVGFLICIIAGREPTPLFEQMSKAREKSLMSWGQVYV